MQDPEMKAAPRRAASPPSVELTRIRIVNANCLFIIHAAILSPFHIPQ